MINFGIMILTITAIGVPSDQNLWDTTEYWKIIYGIPIPILLLSLFLNLCVFNQYSNINNNEN
jgi:hypothetical protein